MEGIIKRDYPVIMGCIIVGTIIVLLTLLLMSSIIILIRGSGYMRKAGKISITLLFFISLLSFAAPFICFDNPDEMINLDSIKEPPGLHHLLGTDNKGRDVLSRVLHGCRISICIALVAALLSMGIGLIVGLVSGYAGGKIDTALMALIDLILSFPSFLLAIGLFGQAAAL